MMVKEPDCLSLVYITASTTTSSGRTVLLGLHFHKCKFNRYEVGHNQNTFCLYIQDREVSVMDFKDLSNCTNITTSLSNNQSWRWRHCISSTRFKIRVENYDDVDFTFFFKVSLSYSLYSSPVSKIQGSKGNIFTIKLLNISYPGRLYVLVLQNYQPWMFAITYIKTTYAQSTENN